MEKNSEKTSDFSPDHPTTWDIEAFRSNWLRFLERIVEENGSSLVPAKRIQNQIEQTAVFRDISARWDGMNGSQRLDAWKQLLIAADGSSREILPACVQCGECCRMGSPTLHIDDLEILRAGKIPWDQLVTLRRGEPARSPFDGRPFVLSEERIKIRERENSRECVFFDSDNDKCSIYDDRPLQCRAQACWDPMPARDLANQPYLLRKHIFERVDLLLEIMNEHESRCGFESLSKAFEKLNETRGGSIDEVLRLLSYEEHFREFVREKFNIPAENLELIFGRSLAGMVGLFGFKVSEEPNGERRLAPEE